MKRRTFLQRIGSILAVLGVTEAEWLTLGDRYYQALAQPNPRKLALLVGINQYQKSPSLSGCITDVELQKELLIHRFGFQASDILTLTEEQASRDFIEAAFLDRLGKQAKSDDVVVFHFSGCGTRIQLESSDTLQNALVPANENQDEKIVDYLLEETLLLLLRSLPTERVTAVLDTSYYTPDPVPLAGLKIRSRPELLAAKLATTELEFLQKLQTQNLSSNPIVLYATSNPKQFARELQFSGFSAGLFTYALTQYLWETTPARTIQVSLSHVGSSMSKLGSKQQPGLLTSKKNQQEVETLPVTSLFLDNSVSSEGTAIAIEEEKTATLWLGGLPPQVLEHYGVNSQLSLLTGERLVLRSRTGLTAKARISKVEGANPPQIGQCQEAVRVLPRNINLIVALDTGLERIERVDATSVFAGIARVSTVVAGEQAADYVFGKLPQTTSRYGLFTLGGELISNTAGEVGEAVKVAVQRLVPKLPTLQAAKLWRLTENEGSSHLQVKGTLEIISGISPRVVMQRETARINTQTTKKSQKLLTTPTVPIGSRMQYRVQNNGDRPVYLMLVGLKNNRTAIAFYPWQTPQEPNNSETKPLLKQVVIAPQETLTFPQTITASEWMISGPAYDCEHQLIFSTNPFSETFKALETAKYPTGEQQPIAPLVNPLEVAQAVLQDLHNASAVQAEISSTAVESYVLDVNHWASLYFSFQVV